MHSEEIRDGSGIPANDMQDAVRALDERQPDGQYAWWICTIEDEGLSMASNLDDPAIWLVKGMLTTGDKSFIMQTLAFLLSILPQAGIDRVREALDRIEKARQQED